MGCSIIPNSEYATGRSKVIKMLIARPLPATTALQHSTTSCDAQPVSMACYPKAVAEPPAGKAPDVMTKQLLKAVFGFGLMRI